MKDILTRKNSFYFKSNFLNNIEILYNLQCLTRAFNKTGLKWLDFIYQTEIVELLLKQESIDINMKDILNHKILIIFKSDFFI